MELLEPILDTLFAFAIGYFGAKLIFDWFDRRLAQKLEREIGPIIRDLDSGKLIPLTVELHDNRFLCYNTLTDDFVCQGENLDEISRNFSLRYPERRATIHKGDSDAIAKLKKELSKDVKNISMPAR